MPLIGQAAMLLNFDVEASAIDGHDDWHTHEHLPERLSIPGFLRGTRWTAVRGSPRYTVLYEVESLEVLASAAYLQRLNNPTPWTSKTMPHYRGMSRGLCSVEGSWGFGMGQFALLVRFKADDESKARAWLAGQLLPGLTTRPGLGSAHLLKGALAAAMTAEQKIRGADAGVDWAILATGYELAAVEALASGDLAIEPLREHGVSSLTAAVYQAAYSLSADEMDAGSNPA